jgi:hypothetical protein
MVSTLPPELNPWDLWDKVRAAAGRGELPIFVVVVDDEVSFWCRYRVKRGSPLLHTNHRTRVKTIIGVMVHTRAEARERMGLRDD